MSDYELCFKELGLRLPEIPPALGVYISAVLNCLAEICAVTGSLNNIKRIVQIRGFVNNGADFHDQTKVLNGASELMLESWGGWPTCPVCPWYQQPAGEYSR